MMDFVQEMKAALAEQHEQHYWGCEHCATPVSCFYARVTEYHSYPVAMEDGEPTVQWKHGEFDDTGDVDIGCPECDDPVDIKPWPVSKASEDVAAPSPSDMLSEEEYADWVADNKEG